MDDVVFIEIYHKTYQQILTYIICHCKHMDDVNDILQETYITLYQAMQKKSIDNIEAYLYGIAKNKIRKHYRFFSRFVFQKSEENWLEEMIDPENIEHKIKNRLTTDMIWERLKKENVVVFKIFYLHYILGYSLKEIANTLNINESNVKNHLYRTLKKLQKDCDQYE